MNSQMRKFDQRPCVVLVDTAHTNQGMSDVPRTQAKIFGPPELSGFSVDYSEVDRLAAGSVLVARSLDKDVGLLEWISAKAHVVAVQPSVFRGSNAQDSP